MPMRTIWEPGFAVGDALIDAQHQALLAQCNLLADQRRSESPEPDAADRDDADTAAAHASFDRAFERLKMLVHEHFEAEASLLAPCGDEALEDHRFECDEFDHLVEQVATTENFSRLEIQRFVAFWCIGHVRGAAEPLRRLLAPGAAGPD